MFWVGSTGRHHVRCRLSAKSPDTEVGACAPTENFQHQRVFPWVHVWADTKFGSGFRVLAVSHLVTVDIDIHARFCPVDGQENFSVAPLLRNIYLSSINTTGFSRATRLSPFWDNGFWGLFPQTRKDDSRKWPFRNLAFPSYRGH